MNTSKNDQNTNVSELSIIYCCIIFGIVLILNPKIFNEILVYKSLNTFLGWLLLIISTMGMLSSNLENENNIFKVIHNIIALGLSFVPILIAYFVRKYLDLEGILDILVNIFCYACAFLSFIIFMLNIDKFKISLNNIKFDTTTDKIKAIATLIPGLVALMTLIFQIFKHFFS
ncbi:hypothetical protein [Macrococcoides canis]|uniref:hypothetical protein n=1 Tax=Macrococcoides canis TaxID=1855823 RepID=UPI00105FF475|nr:hypothetical protein [Macrococcus canis]TDM24410.1 hypothetical protein ETI02_01020 [Macrococcus canis]